MSSATTERLTCPFCDYQDSASSIEAHISGMRDEAHQGKVGKDWREAIEPEVAEESVSVEESEMVRLDAALDQDPESPEYESAEVAGRTVLLGTLLLAGLVLMAAMTNSESAGSDEPEEESLDGLGGLGA